MKLWVVGAKGLLGSSLKKKAPNSIGSSKDEADVTSLSSLRAFLNKHPGITHIVNASAFSLVDLAEKEKESAYLVNAIGPENLGIIAKEMGAKMIHISTDYVFPGNVHRPLHEEDLVSPVNYYGETKLEGEKRLLSVFPSACIIRTACLFGKGGKNFVARMFDLIQEKDEIYLSDDQTNSPTYVEHLTEVILKMLNRSGIYHFSNQGEASKYTFGKEIYDFAKANGIEVKTKKIIPVKSSHFPECCSRPMYSSFDLSKIAKIVGNPAPWQEALMTFLESTL